MGGGRLTRSTGRCERGERDGFEWMAGLAGNLHRIALVLQRAALRLAA